MYSQRVLLSHYGDRFDICARPTYTFGMWSDSEALLDIEDSLLCSFIEEVIIKSVPAGQSCLWTNEAIPQDMIHIVYVKNNHKYYTINLTHYDKTYHYKNGMLEIDGQTMQYDPNFQIVMDNIVNYYINYHPKKKDFIEVIHKIILGKRYQLYKFLFPITAGAKVNAPAVNPKK